MAYIQPNSVVQLFKGINLDNRYLHTIYFGSESAQSTWFTSKVFKSYEGMSYTRYTRNQIKLKDDATTLLGVTYLRFMNTRTNSKWFYAFVTAIEYVNENTVLITYEIDVMQTWFIQNGSVRPCMVLREHTNDDTFGNNIEPEPIGSDSYTSDFIVKSNHFTNYSVVEFNTSNPNDNPNGVLYNNELYCGSYMTATPISSEAAAYNFTTALTQILGGSWDIGNRKAELIDMFTFPTDFCDSNKANNSYSLSVTDPFTYNNYTPKNNKMFTYPYNFLLCTTMNGETAIYRWEYFDSLHGNVDYANFNIYGSPIGGGQIKCYPRLYDGVYDNYDVGLTMREFPKNPFNIDSYQAWVAAGGKNRLEREQAYTNVRGVTALVASATQAYTSGLTGINSVGHNALALGGTKTSIMDDISGIGGGVNRAINGASQFVNTMVDVAEAKSKINYKFADAKYTPNIVVGESSPNLSVPLGSLDFHFFNTHVKDEEAKRIDEFFTMFGYATKRVKTPNITGRQYWNFVQTENCIVAGDMPSSSKEAIARIFDGGITFWHNGDNVGNYNLSSSSGTINNPIV